MDRYVQVNLIGKTYVKDSIGQMVDTETTTTVFGRRESVTRAEWSAAGQNGLKAACRVIVNTLEYSGQDACTINNVRYGIYRVYENNGETELYLEKQVGVTHGN